MISKVKWTKPVRIARNIFKTKDRTLFNRNSYPNAHVIFYRKNWIFWIVFNISKYLWLHLNENETYKDENHDIFAYIRLKTTSNIFDLCFAIFYCRYMGFLQSDHTSNIKTLYLRHIFLLKYEQSFCFCAWTTNHTNRDRLKVPNDWLLFKWWSKCSSLHIVKSDVYLKM